MVYTLGKREIEKHFYLSTIHHAMKHWKILRFFQSLINFDPRTYFETSVFGFWNNHCVQERAVYHFYSVSNNSQLEANSKTKEIKKHLLYVMPVQVYSTLNESDLSTSF